MTRKWRLVLLVSLIGNLTILYVGFKAYEYRSYINYWLDKYLYVIDEFSCREKYEAANSALQSDATVINRVVFFGTQVTEEWPLTQYFPGYEAINRGVTGQRAAGFLLRFQPDVLNLHPRYVVFEVSSYNFLPNTNVREVFDYVRTMAALARCQGVEPILTTCIPPCDDYQVFEHEDFIVRDTAALYSQLVTDLAQQNGYLLADWRTAVVDQNGYLRHNLARTKVDLNLDGYRVIATEVLKVLNPPVSGPSRSLKTTP